MAQQTEDTPMMRQYKSIKNDYQDAYLFFRLGDFYELFYDDAIEVAQILELTLTSRNKAADEPIPMCGVPYHSAQQYIKTLIDQGHRVAICEQVEDPKEAKGMVKREVVQLITPGTVMEENVLHADENNYLAAVNPADSYALAYIDLSTGELKACLLDSAEALMNEISNLQAKEVLMAEGHQDLEHRLQNYLDLLISRPRSQHDSSYNQFYDDHLTPALREVLDLLIHYLNDTQMRSLEHIQQAEIYQADHYLRLGPGAHKNLELQVSLKDQTKKGTLLWLLDESQTAMGSRMLKRWLDKPLIDRQKIEERYDAIENLNEHFFERQDIKEGLKQVYDLERLAGRIAFKTVNARDLIQLKQSLAQIPALVHLVESINAGNWDSWLDRMDDCQDVYQWIDQAIVDDPPISIMEGGIIKQSYHQQLDQYLDAMHHGRQWIAELQEKERQATGIKNLKIGFNKVFGYYIEVTKSNLKFVDEDRYERKQTLTNSERYITPELKEKEHLILEAEEKSQQLEYELFVKLREKIKGEIDRLQDLAKGIAYLDVIQSLTEVSERYRFVRPQLTDDHRQLHIQNGRHPVVEKVMGDQSYVPNDIDLDEETDILLITGPNMSGKSTYMRQLALIIILAQMGSFVPADEACLPIFDQIFTRIGAMDDLIGGQSTFMVEMMEANVALQEATPRSLLLFDEIGRGTATFDGMSLAEAIIIYIHNHIGAKTLFSTHYHELTELEDKLERLKNVHVGAIEENDELIFLHKVEDGPADKSYGVQVAKRAGLPQEVIQSADRLLNQWVEKSQMQAEEDLLAVDRKPNQLEEEGQLTLFEVNNSSAEKEVLEDIQQADLANMTLMDAMNLLNSLQQQLRQNK